MVNQNYMVVDDILKYEENEDFIDFEFYTHFSVVIDENEIEEFKDIQIYNQTISSINNYLKGFNVNVVFLNKTFNLAKDIKDEDIQDLDGESVQKLLNLYSELNEDILMSIESSLPVVTTQMVEKENYIENVIQKNTKVFLRNLVGFDGLGTVAIKISIPKDDLDGFTLKENHLKIGVGELHSVSNSENITQRLSHYFDSFDSNDFVELLNKVNPNYVSELVSYMIVLYKNSK